MIRQQGPQRLQHYTVSLGHSSVCVEARSVAAAISEARKKLSRELPRLWDVIYRLDDHRFQVVCDTQVQPG